MVCPFAFFLRHSKSNKQVVFDLGIHRDIKGFAPAATERFSPVVKQTVADVGDPSPFTTAEFVLGEGSKKALADPGSCHNPEVFSSVRVPEDRLRFITVSDLNVAIGPYPRAMDIFGDGSMYIIDASGHVDGHINILARTSPDGAWILLGADSAHHPDLITGKIMRSLLEVPRVQVLIAHDIYWYEENKGKEVFLPHIILPLVQ
ncbi:uncharacterized protein BJ212DRAFT_1568446 [Suillus subaureus]|uniref:Metallo-beta-lactamase domain-containing protein n=1 Tax=Suillus subaureus TaxID=48587 RepID=A0A9P7EBY1_9AGAM|nr:uncharacterized protein BJ212DRAFT_1568446 [Suillus subaureus]KAG1817280.1 hypothetical protein BJ212DRAFT_1568446 [Suillus subaureus]